MPQVLLRLVAAAVVRQHGVGHRRGLAVAGVVGRCGQEFIALAGHAAEHRRAFAAQHLALPDAEVAAVLGDIDGHVFRAAGVVGGLPADAVLGCAGRSAVGRDGQGRLRRDGIERGTDGGALNRRCGVEQHTRAGIDRRTADGHIGRPHAVGDKAAGGLAMAVRQHQAALRVVQHFAGVGVDGLDQPGGDAGLGVDAGADPQHKALGAGEVEVALEDCLPSRQMDVDVANLQVGQAQAARVQVGVELGHQTDFSHRRRGRVAEIDRVRQRVIGRHIAGAIGTRQRLRAAHADGRAIDRAGGGLLQVLGEVQRLRADRLEVGIEQADMAQVFQLGPAAGEHVEADEMGVLRGVLVVVGRVGRDRHGALDLAAVRQLAGLDVIDRCVRGLAVTGIACRVAVPLLHLREEGQDVGLGAVVLPGLGQQDAGCQARVEADDQLVRADRRGLVGGAQQARCFQRTEPALHPLRLVGGQHGQAVAGCRCG